MDMLIFQLAEISLKVKKLTTPSPKLEGNIRISENVKYNEGCQAGKLN
jgi:hypothetical protein